MTYFKTLLSFLLLALCLPVLGQYEIGAYNFNQSIVNYVKRDVEKIKKAKIQTRTVMQEEIGKNGLPSKSNTSVRYVYNEQGLLIREDFYHGSKKIQASNTYTYNEKNQVIRKSTTYRKAKIANNVIELSYFNDTLLSSLNYIRKGRTTYGYRYFYSSDGKIKEQRSYKKGKLASRIEYDYYEDGSKKEVRYYKDSLKLETTFRYDCGIGNSLLNEKQKDTMTRCSKKEDLGDGTIRTIEETRDEKGRIRRVVYDWNKEKKWSETRSYDAKNRLVYTYRSETQQDGKIKAVITQYKKGKEKEREHFLYWTDNFGFYTEQVFEDDVTENFNYSTYTFHSSIN